MNSRRRSNVAIILIGLGLLVTGACSRSGIDTGTEEFMQAELEWRAARDQSMKEPTSWLTIAGLFWLDEGENSFGTADSCTIQLPEGSAPHRAGRFVKGGDRITVVSAIDGLILEMLFDPQ